MYSSGEHRLFSTGAWHVRREPARVLCLGGEVTGVVLSFIISRMIQAIPLLIGATILIFLLMRLIPGDPALIYGGGPEALPEDVEVLRERFGLEEPLPVQYWIWISAFFQGDMGQSYLTKVPVSDLLIQRMPATIELAVSAMVIAVVVGITSGVMAAMNNGGKIDGLITSFAGVIIAIPNFWLGILAIFLFAQVLGWLPPGGRVSLISNPVDGLKHLILPALILSTNTSATLSRLVKGSTLEVIHEDYVRTAISKGLPKRDILRRHVLRNAMVPVVTVIALQFGRLMGGAVIIESVFAWPGLGRLILTSLNGRDYAIVQGALVMLILIFTTINLFTDIIYGMLDPRIRVGKSGAP